MKLKISKENINKNSKAIFCITIGTISGCVTYQLFIFFKIAIFGWNLGLIFAPIIAGYVETYLAIKLLRESIGAISAFILFIVTVVYGFIIANPTLGVNIITIGSVVIIAQAALPTLINYILIVVVLGIMSYFLGIFKKITDPAYYELKKFYYYYIKREPLPLKIPQKTFYEDYKKCLEINSKDFYFFTVNKPLDLDIEEYIGLYEGNSSFEKRTKIISSNHVKEEKDLLNKLKMGKFCALNNLVDNVKNAGGNGVVNLKIEYEIVDPTKGRFQIIAHGTAVRIKD